MVAICFDPLLTGARHVSIDFLTVHPYLPEAPMALIQCPECGKDVSDTADTCPHCGFLLKPEADGTDPDASEENTFRPFLDKYFKPLLICSYLLAPCLLLLVLGLARLIQVYTYPFILCAVALAGLLYLAIKGILAVTDRQFFILYAAVAAVIHVSAVFFDV
jgi:hypothetical protein